MQSLLVQALRDPAAYDHRPESVEMLQTHISYVFLAGEFVYKIKKNLDLGFLDFSSLEKRRHYCCEEVRLNRRLSPTVYLDVVGITDKSGKISVEGSGKVIEYAVKMIRLPSERMMDSMLERGIVHRNHIDSIIEVLMPFFENAESGPDIDQFGSIETIRTNTTENFKKTRDFLGSALTVDRFRDIVAYTRNFLENRALFENRVKSGKIRECHGDFHSGNICLADEVYIYDCIEFSRGLRCQDIVSETAFLTMDLDFRGRADLSNYCARQLCDGCNDPQVEKLLSFYKCYRAYVRGKVYALAFDQPEIERDERIRDLRRAQRYFALAHRYTGAYHRPKVVAFFGLPGTGKTTLARKLGLEVGWPVIHSDRVRKELAGLDPSQHKREAFEAGLYSRSMTERTYLEVIERAEEFLSEGQSVILDATFRDKTKRELVREMAREIDADVHFILCQCDDHIARKRMEQRDADGTSESDAHWRVYEAQKEQSDWDDLQETEGVLSINTSAPVRDIIHDLSIKFL